MFAAPNTFFTAVGKLTTVTFPSGTSTWTAPANVSLLVSAVGKGADGTAGGWAGTAINFAYVVVNQGGATPYPYSTSPTYGDVYNVGAPAFNGTTGVRTINYYQATAYQNTNTAGGNWGVDSYAYSTLTIDGACYNTGYQSGSVTNATKIADYTGGGQSASWLVWAPNYYIDPTIGAATTGFGLTFPGGSYGPASITTFTNVSVTPNVTYTIVNNGSLTIQYYA